MRNKVFDSVPLMRVAVFLMAGIGLGNRLTGCFSLLPVFMAVLVLALLLWRHELLQSVAIGACFLVLGMLLADRQKRLLAVEWPEGEVCLEAVVVSDPVDKPKTVAVDLIVLHCQYRLKAYLYKDERSRRLRIGDGLQIRSAIDGSRGTTFVKSWNWRKVSLSLKSLSRMERTRLWFLRQRSLLLKRFSRQGMAGDEYAVVAAMALGDKSALTKELKDTYAITGASHVLALSGLHLSIIYALISLLVVGRRWQAVSQALMIAAVWAFVFLVGMPVSVIRAAVMLSVYALLSLGRRDRMSVNTLAFTAIVVLLVSPLSLFDVGFQLSFMAVLAILLLTPLFEMCLSPRFLMSHRVVGWAWGMVAVSCSAQVGVAPLIAYYFGRVPAYFLLTNFIVIPAATLILYLSLAVLVFPSLAFILTYMVSVLNQVLTLMAALPGASIEGLHPSALQTSMWYVILLAGYLLIRKIGQVKGWSPSKRGL